MLFCLIGIALRCYGLGEQIIADDEWHALHKLLFSDYSGIALSFGSADHSIPLTLYYKLSQQTLGLSEWGMRLPMLVAGIGLLVMLPLLLTEEISPQERNVLLALTSLSPLLVYFSRTARPYALTVLFAIVAVFAFRKWWKDKKPLWASIYILSTWFATYLHPLILIYAALPFLYYGLRSSVPWSKADLQRLFGLGSILMVGVLLVIGPPLWYDAASLHGKAAAGTIEAQTFLVAYQLMLGTANKLLTIMLSVFMLLGLIVAWRTRRELVTYLLLINSGFILLVLLLRPLWIEHGLVLARYLLPCLASLLLLVAIGWVNLLQHIANPVLRTTMSLVLLSGLVLAGPLPANLVYPNQFTGHARFQFDYDVERNVYRSYVKNLTVSSFYRELATKQPGSLTIIEAPWRYEWHFNPLDYYQQIHRQHIQIGFIEGLCGTDSGGGEYGPNVQGMRFGHFVSLANLLNGKSGSAANYLVFHKQPWWPSFYPRPELGPCIRQANERFGTAIHEDDLLLVFAVR